MIEVKNLSFSYDPSDPPVLKDISFQLEKGHCLAILGNNGAGKSTLLKCVNMIHKARSGSILVDGKDLGSVSRRDMAKLIAYVPQHSSVTRTMVFDAILLGRKPYIQWDATNEDRLILSNLIRELNLERFSAKYITELSGGELQKVVLARALAQQPQYLLLDEPTSSLDPRNQHDMLSLINSIAKEQQIGVAIVIHDLNLAVRYCDQFLFLHDSVIYSQGDLSAVTPKAIRDVYHLDVDIIRHKGRTLIAPN